MEAQTNRALLRTAGRVIVVADSSKIGKRGFAKISDISAASDIVTDSEADRRRHRGDSSGWARQCTSSTYRPG